MRLKGIIIIGILLLLPSFISAQGKYSMYLTDITADSLRIDKGRGIQWDNTAGKYFTQAGANKTYFGGADATIFNTWTKKQMFNDDSTGFRGKWYIFPANYQSGGVWYDSLGNGTLKWGINFAKLEKNQIFTGVNKFNKDSVYFNSLLYKMPSTGRIAGSVLYDSLGDGVYKFRKMQPYISTAYPLARNGDSIVFRYQTTNLKLTNNRLDLIQNIRTTDSPTFAGFTALNGNIPQVGNYGFSNNYASGINGTGFNLYKDATSTYLEVDNIFVRNTLRTHIFQKDVVKASNGILYVSDSGVISSVNAGGNQVGFDSEKSASFANGTTVWVKDFNDTGTIVSVKFTINSSAGGTGETVYNVTVTEGALASLKVGMTGVRTSGGRVVLDASSANSPYVDIWDGTTIYGRYGNLAGITDADFGTLSGYGIYSINGFFKGLIRGSAIRGGTYETSDAANTSLSSIFIDGTSNSLQFRKAGRSSATSYSLAITGDAFNGNAGIAMYDGVIRNQSIAMDGGFFPSFSSLSTSEFQLVNRSQSLNGTSAVINTYKTGGEAIGLLSVVTSTSGVSSSYGIKASATQGTNVYGIYADAGGGTNNYAGYFDAGNVYIKNELQIGTAKAVIDASGRITKINNLSPTAGKYLRGDGTSFTPENIQASDLPAGTVTASANTTFSGNLKFSGSIALDSNAVTLSGTTVDVSGKRYIEVTPTATYQNITNFTNGVNRQVVTIVNTNASYTILFETGTYIKVPRSLQLTQWDSITFIYSPAASKWICISHAVDESGI